jgi:hypothetical protein
VNEYVYESRLCLFCFSGNVTLRTELEARGRDVEAKAREKYTALGNKIMEEIKKEFV